MNQFRFRLSGARKKNQVIQMKILILFAIIAAASAADFNENELCHGLLFSTLPHPSDKNLFIGCIK